MNDTTMLRFRESFRGYNKDDVNAYIEQIHMKFTRREAELRAQLAELSNSLCCQAGSDEALVAELEAAKLALSRTEAENKELKTMIEASKTAMAESNNETAEKSKLYDSMSAQVGNILIVANSNAEKILGDAKREADRIKCEAEEAKTAMIAALETKLKAISDQCLREYEMLVSEAKVRFGQITEDMKMRSEDLLATTERKSRELEIQITGEYATSEVE